MFIAENVGHKKRRGKYTKINNGFTGTALPLFVTLQGKFDWISLVGEAAQHKRLKNRLTRSDRPERKSGGKRKRLGISVSAKN
jgi:hypothetical protein